jgi:hypothetical protein
MAAHPERTAQEWYEEATRAYVEGHQACAWCGSIHQVYRGQRSGRDEYYCPACDFYTFHNPTTGQYFAAMGQEDTGPAQVASSSTSQMTTV